MFRTLRWKLVGAFGLVILLTVVLSLLLAYGFTTRSFDILATEESREKARDMAPMLEDIYDQWGGWQDLDALMGTQETQTDSLFETPWISDVDWWRVVATTVGVDEPGLGELLDELGTLEAVAAKQGVSTESMVEAILGEEEAALRWSGRFSEPEIQKYLADIRLEALSFLSEGLPDSYDTPVPGSELVLTDTGVDWIIETVLLGEQRLLVADNGGTVVYDSANKTEGEHLPDSTLEQGSQLVGRDGDSIGWAIIAAGSEYYNAHQRAFLGNLTWVLIISGLLIGVVATLIGWGIARKVTAPVSALTGAATRMADGDGAARVSITSNDELGRMGAAFNTMAEGLEDQQALRNRLVDDIAHEFKTPLSVMQLELFALKDGMQTPRQAVTNMQQELDQLNNLVSDITLLSETEEGEFQLDLELADLGELTSLAVARWQPLAKANGVDLNLIPVEIPSEVRLDSMRIVQVLGNLIANALQHTPGGGTVEVRCESATAPEPGAVGGDARFIWTTVTDTGEGISPEDLPFIFDRFYRADRSRSRRTGGKGLGLAIARRIVEGHGGTVWAESQPGAGSTFGYSLPIPPGPGRHA